jgi:hypothetical protein
MSKVKQLFGSNSLFAQVAVFSVAGLSMSLGLVLNYNLQIGTPWL